MLITSAPRSGGDVVKTPDPRRWWALTLLCGAFFMVLLEVTIVLVALPSIGADPGFSEQGVQWVLSAYALTFGGLLLLGGRRAALPRRSYDPAGALTITGALVRARLRPRRGAGHGLGRRADDPPPRRLRGARERKQR
jgi:MFS family permease